jgi:hypothetical protein
MAIGEEDATAVIGTREKRHVKERTKRKTA